MHNWSLTSEPEGHVLIIKHSFLKHSEDEQLKQLVQRLRSFNYTYLHLTSEEERETLFDLLERQSISDDFYHKAAIEGLLKALIGKILILVHSSVNHFNKSTHLYAHYLDLLNRQSKSHRKVSHYARQLGASPKNLNAACHKAVNQTASKLITMQILGEAKRLLFYTHNTASQIAYQLGFTDPSYFVKYFKRHLNVTPEAFRKLSFSK